ncbi:YcaO-like family protein [Dactylosporangium sp. CA-092794]|uniref:YcaO-like family protein n=1 Tax=Dactylosporangium sp. CA-092794 TaxID=3239929 RepID=UPI003D8C0068
MSTLTQAIRHRSGTYRTLTAAQTWERVRPQLPAFAITRVADITLLDEIGLPVHVAYRPTGKTLAVSVGTGLTHDQARVSAVMESIEGWHAENPRLEIIARSPAGDLDVGYDVRSLNLPPRSPLTGATVVDWVAGRGVLTGREYPIPFDPIFLDFTDLRPWGDVLFRPTSSGLASGNTLAEATLHALHELVERDCMTPYALSGLAQRVYVDPASSRNPDTLAVLAAIRSVDCWVEVCDLTNDVGIPCYGASIWSEDIPMIFGGFGCHIDPDIAVGRALAEAAQSRLTTISGARDDIDGNVYRYVNPLAPRPATIAHAAGAIRRHEAPSDSIDAALRFAAERVHAKTGVEPIVVDLTRAGIGIPVSKVFAPGLLLMDDHALSARPKGNDG